VCSGGKRTETKIERKLRGGEKRCDKYEKKGRKLEEA